MNPSTVLQAVENISKESANLKQVHPSISKEYLESNENQHLTPPLNNKETGLPALPVAEIKNKRPRKKLPSSTPVKTTLEVIQQEKMEKKGNRSYAK